MPCPVQQTETCTNNCPIDCYDGDWGGWTACSAAACGPASSEREATKTGTRTRTWVNGIRSGTGAPCPVQQQEACSNNCVIDCYGGGLEQNWSACSGTAYTCLAANLETERIRYGKQIKNWIGGTEASNNGITCASKKIEQDCYQVCKASIVESNPIIPDMIKVSTSGDKYIIFDYTSDSVGLTGQTEYTFTVSNYNMDNATILFVAGGGGGGCCVGGGGGGGDVSFNTITIPIGSHKIRVGKGGLGSSRSNNSGGQGNNSSLILQSGIEYTYCGGGGGGSFYATATAGRNNSYSSGGGGGGSGGGFEDINTRIGGSGNNFSGNGGTGAGGLNVGGLGGGGGAVGHGYSSTSSVNGNGGEGITYNITGSNIGYGGGGGAGGSSGGSGAVTTKNGGSGIHGGGSGANYYYYHGRNSRYNQPRTTAGIGIDGTGGGGGGGYDNVGAKGGNGVIIIKYNAMKQK